MRVIQVKFNIVEKQEAEILTKEGLINDIDKILENSGLQINEFEILYKSIDLNEFFNGTN